ncbi:MAG: beta-ketoacyl-[acyl-carrier-protein] synthase family protein, partial [Nitrospirae bacterium]|nr:beta-ketoacyl-[acyl-carrier-protein] synthase family protein [Nitrospirota bacterium]
MLSAKRKVVVTGLGMATSLGLDVEQNWQKALEGVSGIRALALKGTGKSPVQAVGEVEESDWQRIQNEFPEYAEVEGERRSFFALWAAKSALKDAGLIHEGSGRCDSFPRVRPACRTGRGQVDTTRSQGAEKQKEREFRNPDFEIASRYGVVLAAGLGINRLEDVQKWATSDGKFDYLRFGKEYKEVHKESIMRNNANRPSSLIAKKFGFHGTNCTITTACASSTQAIGIAFRAIQRGDADLIVTGGSDSMINPVGLVFFVLLGAAAISAESPGTICRPFDRKRSGLVMGEGAGIAVLEEESHALKRGAEIYAEVTGYGSSMDAHQVTAPHPQGTGAEQSMNRALGDARLRPEEVDYINA